MRRDFLKDLERCGESGPWDIVIFSGDLSFSGKRDQFQQVEGFIQDLPDRIGQLGLGDPLFLAVPGNHDLRRPVATNPVAITLSNLTALAPATADPVWTEIATKPASSYRRTINRMFADYLAWWDPWKTEARRRYPSFQDGLLPGEFAVTIEKRGCRFGIVGLNTTYLQVNGDNFSGRLAVHVEQYNRLLPPNDADWADKLDAAILITHQPPEWLSPANRMNVFNPLIAPTGRFALHLCGHLHIASAQVQGRGGSEVRRVALGRSLLALEPTLDGLERLHGYEAFRIKIDKGSPDGLIRMWPRS